MNYFDDYDGQREGGGGYGGGRRGRGGGYGGGGLGSRTMGGAYGGGLGSRTMGGYGGGYGQRQMGGRRNRGNWRDGVRYDGEDRYYGSGSGSSDDYGGYGFAYDSRPREFTPQERMEMPWLFLEGDDDDEFTMDSGRWGRRERGGGALGRRGGYGRRGGDYYGGMGGGRGYDGYDDYDYDPYVEGGRMGRGRGQRAGRGSVDEWGNLIGGAVNRSFDGVRGAVGDYYDDYQGQARGGRGQRAGRGSVDEWGNLVGGAVTRSFDGIRGDRRRRY